MALEPGAFDVSYQQDATGAQPSAVSSDGQSFSVASSDPDSSAGDSGYIIIVN